MKIIIGGDLVPTESNKELFVGADTSSLLGKKLLEIWQNADLRIFNLETPLADIKTPIKKAGPNLITSTSAAKGIKALNPSLISLANNHIMDHGNEGLKSTQKILQEYEIPYIGVGKNLKDASKAFIIEKDGKKVGIYACAEHEFSIATEEESGANPFDPLESLDHVRELKEKCECVIVLYHGGKEHYRYPTPLLQKTCRKLVAKGADIVICQHSHCIGCFEEYESGTIIYGQGNFIFDDVDDEFWNNSLLINISLEDKVRVSYIPIEKNGAAIQVASDSEGAKILEDFNKRSAEILVKGAIEKKYSNFAKQMVVIYLSHLSGYGKWRYRIHRYLFRGKLLKRRYSKKTKQLQNIIECEAHQELMLEGLKTLVNKQ